VRLPSQPTSLVGRERELAATRGLLLDGGVRLLTLCGPAGTGKTRLAVALASSVADAYADGVIFVDLAAVHDPDLVAATIARGVDLAEGRERSAEERLREYLAPRQVLLVLDNFEQVRVSATLIGSLLDTCPRLAVLVTSRTPLRLSWEHLFPVPTLPVDEAVELFVQRARAMRPGVARTAANAEAIAELCRRLDGLPLAIELAAARSDVLPPRVMLARMQEQLDVLSGGPVDRPARQQTLRAAFDWSYALLGEEERVLFRRLAVCVGGFSLEWAERLGARLDVLSALVRNSLVRVVEATAEEDATPAEPRFWMLETIRAYAREQLERSGERDAVQRQHAELALELAQQAAAALLGPRQAEWVQRLEREHDNLRAALRWALEAGALDVALGLANCLWRFWWLHGFLSEGRAWLEEAVAASDGLASVARAQVLNGAGVLAHVRAEYARAATLLEASLALSRELGWPEGTARALHNLGALARELGDWPRATDAYTASLALERDLGNQWGIGTSLNNLGALARDQGDLDEAARLHGEALALLRASGDERGIAAALHNLAAVAADRGEWPTAASLHAESLAVWRRLGDRWGMATALREAGWVAGQLGDRAQAVHLLQESLALFGELGVPQGTAGCLEALAEVVFAAGSGPADVAVRLLAAAEAGRESVRSPLPVRDRPGLARLRAELRTALGARAFRAAWQAGRQLTLAEASAEAMRLSEATAPTELLSVREREVAELVARGLTNRQIAERLVISERTVDRHVSNIFAKLGVVTRAHLAAWVVERQRA